MYVCISIYFGQLAIEKYESMFPAFSDSRECKLLKVSEKDSSDFLHFIYNDNHY